LRPPGAGGSGAGGRPCARPGTGRARAPHAAARANAPRPRPRARPCAAHTRAACNLTAPLRAPTAPAGRRLVDEAALPLGPPLGPPPQPPPGAPAPAPDAPPPPRPAAARAAAFVDLDAPSKTVPASFVGISHEWLDVEELVDPEIFQLLLDLQSYGNGGRTGRAVGGAARGGVGAARALQRGAAGTRRWRAGGDGMRAPRRGRRAPVLPARSPGLPQPDAPLRLSHTRARRHPPHAGPLVLRIGGGSTDIQRQVPGPAVWETLRRLHKEAGALLTTAGVRGHGQEEGAATTSHLSAHDPPSW
jgi:hypothetical protein